MIVHEIRDANGEPVVRVWAIEEKGGIGLGLRVYPKPGEGDPVDRELPPELATEFIEDGLECLGHGPVEEEDEADVISFPSGRVILGDIDGEDDEHVEVPIGPGNVVLTAGRDWLDLRRLQASGEPVRIELHAEGFTELEVDELLIWDGDNPDPIRRHPMDVNTYQVAVWHDTDGRPARILVQTMNVN